MTYDRTAAGVRREDIRNIRDQINLTVKQLGRMDEYLFEGATAVGMAHALALLVGAEQGLSHVRESLERLSKSARGVR